MNSRILAAEVQDFLKAHSGSKPATIALKKSPFEGVSSSELAHQIDGQQRVQKKIPSWSTAGGLYYPDKLNVEQCSSAETGQFKQALVPAGGKLIDLTGGFGVDSYYFSLIAASVTHCEINSGLSEIVRHNMRILHRDNILCIDRDGIAYLREQQDSYDMLYIDPSRRVNQQKVFRLEDCVPNVVELQFLFLEKAKLVVSKIAPLLDISLALTALKHVREVFVISVHNDCKELLFVQDRHFEGVPTITAVRLGYGQQQQLSFTLAQEKETQLTYASPQAYIYEADAAFTKAGAFKMVSSHYNVQKLHQHSHLYTSEHFKAEFPGRAFLVEGVYPFSAIKKQVSWKKANVSAKNFPLKVDEIKKKFKIADGGDTYLFFTTDATEALIIIVCSKVIK